MADMAEMLDAYLFIDHVDPGKPIGDVLRDIFDQNGSSVRFTAQFAGPFIGFVALTVPGLEEIHRLATGSLWEAGLRCETAVVVRPGLRVPKRGSPDVCALVRVRTDDPDGVLDELDSAFGERQLEQEQLPYDERTFNYGAAIVNGRYDLLVDVGRPTLAETRELVRDQVRPITGPRTVTAFAHLPGNARRREL